MMPTPGLMLAKLRPGPNWLSRAPLDPSLDHDGRLPVGTGKVEALEGAAGSLDHEGIGHVANARPDDNLVVLRSGVVDDVGAEVIVTGDGEAVGDVTIAELEGPASVAALVAGSVTDSGLRPGGHFLPLGVAAGSWRARMVRPQQRPGSSRWRHATSGVVSGGQVVAVGRDVLGDDEDHELVGAAMAGIRPIPRIRPVAMMNRLRCTRRLMCCPPRRRTDGSLATGSAVRPAPVADWRR